MFPESPEFLFSSTSISYLLLSRFFKSLLAIKRKLPYRTLEALTEKSLYKNALRITHIHPTLNSRQFGTPTTIES